ncbi:MAG: hypothetical protein M3O21_03110 [Chloroflexota bacterium]|nr:hypothetical protein [Chloroflexota bacterium]
MGHAYKAIAYRDIEGVIIRRRGGLTSWIPPSREPAGPNVVLKLRRRCLISPWAETFLFNRITVEVIDTEEFSAALSERIAEMT